MKTLERIRCALFALVFCTGALWAELPAALKPTADEYEKAQKSFDASVAARKKVASDAYVAVLEIARKREAAANRPAQVAAIDAEIAAVKANGTGEKAPEQFPADLAVYRDRFIADLKRAVASAEGARKLSTEQYLKWLSSMEAVARGKDKVLLEAVVAEQQRVRAAVQTTEPKAK